MDLRAKGWVLKNQGVVPSTLAQVHEAAAKEAHEKSATSKPIPIVRNGSRRGQNRSEIGSQKDGDAWMSMGSSARSFGRTNSMMGSLMMGQSKIDDSLKSFGTMKSASSNSGGFHSLTRLSSEPGTSRMSRQPSEPGKSRSKRGGGSGGGGESRQVNRHTSVDFAHLDAVVDSGNTGRKRLQLLPRSVAPPAVASSIDDNNAVEPASSLAATFEEPPSMTEEQARTKVEEDLKEFMQIRDIDEAVGYFESLPSDMRYLLVDKFVTKMDSKESDVVLICELFERVVSSGLCPIEVFEQGFAPTIEALEDISLDVPSAYVVMARLLRASKLPRGLVDRLSGTINIDDAVLVHPRDKLMKEFDGTE
jgi:translation initiation factor 4G